MKESEKWVVGTTEDSMSSSPRRRRNRGLSNAIIAALITTVGAIVVAVITVLIPILFRPGTSTPTASPSVNSSTTPTQTASVQQQYAYDFEQGTTEGWDTTEGSEKLATLQVVSDPVGSGNHVLQVITVLNGNSNFNNGINLHTEAKVYFTQKMPQGFNNPPPYNFFGKQVSCQVYLPPQLASGSPPATIIIFVKDANQRNDSGKPMTIDASAVGKWTQISLVVGEYPVDADQGFDGTQIIGVGIRIAVPAGSSLNYTGPFYIDNCILPH